MIRFTRTAITAGGHAAEAMTFAGKVTQLVNDRFPQVGLRWGMQVGGTAGVVHWTMDLDDLAAVQELFSTLMADGEYLSLVDSSGGVFVPGSVHDTMVSIF